MNSLLMNYLPLVVALSTGIVYAESTYLKTVDFKQYSSDTKKYISKNRIDEIQELIDFLNYKKINNRISTDELWRLEHLRDKKTNLLRQLM